MPTPLPVPSVPPRGPYAAERADLHAQIQRLRAGKNLVVVCDTPAEAKVLLDRYRRWALPVRLRRRGPHIYLTKVTDDAQARAGAVPRPRIPRPPAGPPPG